MLTRKLLPLSAMVLALGLSGLTTHVNATDNTYGNGAIITVPKKMQGTWYSYDRNVHNGRKITFTAHTVNGKIIYTQDKSIISDYFNGNIQNQTDFDHVTKNWMSGQTTKMKNHLFYEINPWISFENWSLYRVMLQKINGKKHNVLLYSSRYDGGNYYRSKKLAKQMKNYKFKKVDYHL